MRPLQSDRLPSKARMIFVLSVCGVGYATLELLGVIQMKDVSAATKLLLTRLGVLFAYVGALLAGLQFYWDARAERIAAEAEQKRNRAQRDNDLLRSLGDELQKEYQAILDRNDTEARLAEAELKGTSLYLRNKNWLGKVALVGVFLGAVLQIMGST